MFTKSHNLSPLAARILSIVETSNDCTRKDIASQLDRKRSRLLSNDIAVLDKLVSQGLIEAEEYGQADSFKRFYIYRKAK